MFNLIRKDIVLQKKMLMIMLPVIVIYLILGTSSIWVGILISIVMIMDAFSSDEKTSINLLLNSLPYTRKEIVSSKYIGAIFLTCVVVFIIFIGNLVIHQEITAWIELAFIVSVVMVFISLIFPFSYKFKSKYLLFASIVFFAIYLLVIKFFIPNLFDEIREYVGILLTLQSTQFYLLIAFSIIVLYVCSWLLSIRIYRKKVF